MYVSMILIEKTTSKCELKFSEIKRFSKHPLFFTCDYCDCECETTFVKYYSSKKNNINQSDCCKECVPLKRKATYITKYGVDNPTKKKEFIDKAKSTNKFRYGSECALHNKEVKQKSKDTCIKKYGVDNPFKSNLVKDKIKETCKERYGVDFYSQSDLYKESVINTCIGKYGVYHPMMNDDVKTKMLDTNSKRHGGVLMGSDTIRNKIEKTNLIKYGDSVYSKTDDFKEKARQTNFENLYNNLTTGRLKQLSKPLFSVNEYVGVDSSYKFECVDCSNIFIDTLDDGKIPLCPICYPVKTNGSKFESGVIEWVSDIRDDITVVSNAVGILGGRFEVDIYIPELKIAIECNGNYYHSELSGNKNKHYHLNKTNECEKKGIQLIHIFEDEWLFQNDIVKSRLLNMINPGKKIFGRKCHIKEIDFNTKSTFLTNHHLQGDDVSQTYIGSFYEGELIAVMTFTRCRFTKDHSIELSRYCTSVATIGVAGKLLKYYTTKYNPHQIISYADRRYSMGQLYKSLGFDMIHYTNPSYHYISRKNYLQRFNRLNYMKSKLEHKLNQFDGSLSEWQNMQLNGYDRIWDCGSIKFEMITHKKPTI